MRRKGLPGTRNDGVGTTMAARSPTGESGCLVPVVQATTAGARAFAAGQLFDCSAPGYGGAAHDNSAAVEKLSRCVRPCIEPFE